MAERDDIEFEWVDVENPPRPSDKWPDMRDIWSEVDKHESSLIRRIKSNSLGRLVVKIRTLV